MTGLACDLGWLVIVGAAIAVLCAPFWLLRRREADNRPYPDFEQGDRP